MKQLLICLLAAFTFAACSDDENINITPTERGTVTDDMGNVYEWVRIGDQDWTTSNACNGTPVWEAMYYNPDLMANSYVEFYYDHDDYLATYGNLLSYEEALASAPEGWRLPTDDDWKRLERALGMGNEVNNVGWRGDIAAELARIDGGAELGLKLGGSVLYTSESYSVGCILRFEGESGYYWTATVDESKPTSGDYEMVFFRKLVSGQKGIERQSGNNSNKWMSVRWVRDAQ